MKKIFFVFIIIFINIFVSADDGHNRRVYIGKGGFFWIIWGHGITPLMESTDINKSQSYIDRGDNPNDRDVFGRTALMLHSFFGVRDYIYPENQKNMVQFLIENGAGLDIRDNEGRTALFYAIWVFNIEAIQLLIDNGADVNFVDNKGYTPLDIATIQYPYSETLRMIEILTTSGARNARVINNDEIIFHRNALLENYRWPKDLHIGYADR